MTKVTGWGYYEEGKYIKVPIVTNPSPLEIGLLSPFPLRLVEKCQDIQKEELTIYCKNEIEEEIGEERILCRSIDHDSKF